VLVPDGQFSFAQLPGLYLYPDDSSPASFYAIPARPRIASRDDGKPEISLMVRTKKINYQTEVTGGFLTLSISVGISKEEEASLLSLLSRKLAQDAPPDPDQPPPTPRLLAWNWLSTVVDLTVGGKTNVAGQPSMMGDNRCAFSINLNTDQAKSLYKSWQQGKLDLYARYQLKVQAGPRSSASAQFSSTQTATRDGSTLRVASAAGFSASASASAPLELDLQGDLELPTASLKDSLTDMNL
jgi:hypothetical protein